MKILVTYLDKENGFSEEINKALTNVKANAITDVYFFTNGIVEDGISGILSLIPSDEINKHLFLSGDDRIKLSFNDYYYVKENRKDVEIVADDMKIVVTSMGRFILNNDFYDKSNVDLDDEGIYITNGDSFVFENKYIVIDKVTSLIIDVDNNKFLKI